LSEFAKAIRAADTAETHADLLAGMFTLVIDRADLIAIAEENLKLPRDHAATLLTDNCIQDWRNVIRAIRLPTLVVAGEASVHPLESQRWIADAIAGAQLEIIPADRGGSHFMFYENPKLFNAAVIRFLTA